MCIFCDIVSGKIPCYKIYEDDDVLAFLDTAKDVDGHTLVIPKKHCENLLDCDDDVISKVMSAVKKISNHYVKDCGFDGVNVHNASGACAGQSVFHLHFHILPRTVEEPFNFIAGHTAKHELDEMQNKLRLKY